MLRLQGFSEDFKIVVDHSAIRAQAGNAVAVPVISAIATQMMIALDDSPKWILQPTTQQYCESSIPFALRRDTEQINYATDTID